MNYSWEEEDPYRLGYGGYQPPAAPSYTPQAQQAQPQVPITPNPLIAGAELGLGVLGTGFNAYGAYKAGKAADRQYNLEKDEFQFNKALSLEDRQRAEEEKRRRAELEAGNYAGDFLENNIRGYGGYNAMRG